ncbi:MAG: DEAD/DEAH box helicase [Corynebacterium sp.]|nr:DEAD/DEAH box helicase [Corynebacterium sp.]
MNTFLTQFAADLPFSLDDFQRDGCAAVEAGTGGLVCAPTGAGKTVVGEFAVALALHQGLKCFYTTPIKALSNQKFHDLTETYGEEAVGLLTGDDSINGAADIVVMTTEVLRNMIYAESTALDRLGYVVMDEIHYLADRSRGAVWEEVLLNLRDSVSVIGLSATVSNAEEFGEWMRSVRGDTQVIVSEVRPVPLTQFMIANRQLYPMLRGTHTGDDVRPARPKPNPQLVKATKRVTRAKPLGRPQLIELLRSHGMLPAIDFIFSRAGCDGAVAQCQRAHVVLTNPEEQAEIAAIVDAGVADIPREDLDVLQFSRWRSALIHGFAAHHAGLLPAFKHIVEQCFVRGLIKMVFATETLALGINMPAKTVVLEKLVKYNGEAHVDLTPGEYTQLTGRAGRRGIDTKGNAVVEWEPELDVYAVVELASTRTYPLMSTFAPGYNMSVNLLATVGYTQAKRLIEMSFAQFQADRGVVELRRQLDGLARDVDVARTALDEEIAASEVTEDEVRDYLGLIGELSALERKATRDGAKAVNAEITAVLKRLTVGEVIALPGKKRPVRAVVVEPAKRAGNPRRKIVTETGWIGWVGPDDLAAAPVPIGRMRLDKSMSPKRAVARGFHNQRFPAPKKVTTRAPKLYRKEIDSLRASVRAHAVHQCGQREELLGFARVVEKAEANYERIRSRIDAATNSLGLAFEHIIEVLGELGYVDNHTVTDLGAQLALIHNEADLLIAECVKDRVWEGLDPAELAGTVSTVVFESRGEGRATPQFGSAAMGAAIEATHDTHRRLQKLVLSHNLPPLPEMDAAFAQAMHQWTAGAPLAYALAAAAASGAEITAGDFVRWARRVVDTLEQIAKASAHPDLTHTARQAIGAIRRGVVALGN